jgi:hypothetical protein
MNNNKQGVQDKIRSLLFHCMYFSFELPFIVASVGYNYKLKISNRCHVGSRWPTVLFICVMCRYVYDVSVPNKCA